MVLHIALQSYDTPLVSTRDILIPDDMTLNALHFAIQRLYGFYNEHLHEFTAPDGIKALPWTDYYLPAGAEYADEPVEIINNPEPEEDESVRSWLKRCYSGCYLTGHVVLEADKPSRLLREGQTVKHAIEKFGKLFYHYDMGDNWEFVITESDIVPFTNDVNRMYKNRCPVGITSTGPMLIEDVGGIGGMVNFLKAIKGKKDDFGYSDDIEGTLQWAESQGWKKYVPKRNML